MKRLCSGFGLACTLFLSSCASAPSPPSTAAAAPAQSSRTEQVRLICNDSARIVKFSTLGSPKGEYPLEVAIADSYVWVLFRPARLLRIQRDGDNIQTEMRLGDVDELWSAIDVDPVDGSIWVASERQLVLQKIDSNWRTTTVKLQNEEGAGGFYQLKVAKDAVYVRPTCAETAIWKVDRSSGKVLGTAFPVPEKWVRAAKDDPMRDPALLNCAGAFLERDAEGRILVWDYGQEKAFELDSQGVWTESGTRIFDFLPAVGPAVAKGINVGGKNERWALDNGMRTLFSWKGTPVFLGPWLSSDGGVGATLLYIPGSGGETVREVIDTCPGVAIHDIATSATSYVALTDDSLIFGDFATAPDLP